MIRRFRGTSSTTQMTKIMFNFQYHKGIIKSESKFFGLNLLNTFCTLCTYAFNVTLPQHKRINDHNSQNVSPVSHFCQEPPEEISHKNPQTGLLLSSAAVSQHCPWPTPPQSMNPESKMELVCSGVHLPFHLRNSG